MQIIEKIKKEIDNIRPHLQIDGGDVEFVDFDQKKGILKLKLQGACLNCPMSQITLHQGMERVIKEKIPEVKNVVVI